MKKIQLLVLSLFPTIFFSSCGGHMDDWPYCDLPDDLANYTTVTIEIIKKDYKNNYDKVRNDKYYSDSSEVVLNFYNLIENMHVSPKATNKTFNQYLDKVSIIFEKHDLNYTFDYYELSMADGYFVFNFQEIYEFRGNFYGVVSNAISQNSEKLIKL